MKHLIFLPVVCLGLAGCADMDLDPGGSCSPFSRTDASGTDSLSAPATPTGPQMVLPATGGPPVLGLPLGGSMYLPTDGGAPIVGTGI